MSDFPEFDQARRDLLIKDPNDRFEQLAADAHFNVYHSDIWRGTARKFAELIVRECAVIVKDCDIIKEVDDGEYQAFEAGYLLKKHFGVE